MGALPETGGSLLDWAFTCPRVLGSLIVRAGAAGVSSLTTVSLSYSSVVRIGIVFTADKCEHVTPLVTAGGTLASRVGGAVPVPSTLLGLLVFAVLLAPGFVYIVIRERRTPERQLSAFRETAELACISLATNGTCLLLFAVVRGVAPGLTPDVGALIRNPQSYLTADYAAVAGWGSGLLLLAMVLAGTAAYARWDGWIATRMLARVDKPLVSPTVSAWWLLFNKHPGARLYVGCVLNDGGYVAGWLHSFSNAASDIPDRDLTLTAPIYYRAPGRDDGNELPNVGAVSVSARQLGLLLVSYVDPAPADPAASDRQAAGAGQIERSLAG